MPGRAYIVILTLSVLFGCIDRFYPDEIQNIDSKIVIDGLITDSNDSLGQYVFVSQSTRLDSLRFKPKSNCKVIVVDSGKREFAFYESSVLPGQYIGTIPDSIISEENAFRLKVETPEGKIYESAVEHIKQAPEIGTIYYEIKKFETDDPEVSYWGVQFFVDFNADERYGNYYRFEIEESYEYHSQWPIQLYISENNEWIDGSEDFSFYYCYKTDKLKETFTLSTEGFTQNTYIKFPLHSVLNKTQRLAHNYSFNIKQYTLSKTAHSFWNSMRENSQVADNMFGRQPAPVIGNIVCKTNPSETVLGYFGVSSMQQKRITYKGGIDIPFGYMQCEPMIVDILPAYRPLYLMYVEEDGEKVLAIQMTNCVICTELGGVLEKPWFFE